MVPQCSDSPQCTENVETRAGLDCFPHGKWHKCSWQSRAPQATIKKTLQPGDCVSVDQMISTVPGFVSQNTGKLTRKRHKVATVFVDHFSRLGCAHVHTTTNADEAIEAKQAFERFAQVHGVTVKHCHADDGIFNSKEFLDHIHASKQTISFCGVGMHHQSGLAEHRIGDLAESACTQLLHVQHIKPKAVNASLFGPMHCVT